MTTELAKTFTISQISKMDLETRELTALLSSSKIKIGLEVAMRLKEFRDNKLYAKLDNDSYPTFNHYLNSVGINYKVATEIIALYESFVIAGEQSIDFLASIPYHNLTIIKPTHFRKENGQYLLTTSKSELRKDILEAKSGLTQEDLRQKRREDSVGPHEHDMQKVCFKKCTVCGLKEFFHEEKKESQV